MELKDILHINIQNLEADEQQNVLNIVSRIEIESIPKKNVKKVFQIAQQLLKNKAEEVDTLRSQIPETSSIRNGQSKDSTDSQTLQIENEKLKKIIIKLESDKAALKTRIRDLTDDMSSLRKRFQEANASDKDDSSDLLSDLDRKEELLKNINVKNKHIKRLLHDIEVLEKRAIEHTKLISTQEEKLNLIERELNQINDKYSMAKDTNDNLNEKLTKANEEIDSLEQIVQRLQNERERVDVEFKSFVDKLEEKAHAWRKILDDKEDQMESMRKKYNELYLKYPGKEVTPGEEIEAKQLIEAIHERDSIIEELEGRLQIMADEMMSSTRLMNQLSQDRELSEDRTVERNKQCCGEVENALEQANRRCRELSEMLDTVEEDNALKSRQTMEAIAALQAFQNGDDGLPQALRKIGQLQQKLGSRDKQIKALIMEINSMHDLSQENLILRKKLNIPEDAVISTTNLVAKQRSKDKLIDRLTLKLRASEEMRLNLKLEMNELRKELKNMKSVSSKPASGANCDTLPQHKPPQANHIENVEPIYCANCLKCLKKLPDKDKVIREITNEWESKYSSVIEENENLRVGMHEILERIREYDVSSNHITIDCTILERVLHALDARSISGWYHPAMRMQNELIALKEREQALKEQINIVEKATIIKQNIPENAKVTLDSDIKPEQNEGSSPSKDGITINAEATIDKSQSLYSTLVHKDIQYDKLRDKFLEVSQKYRDVLLDNEKLKCFEALYDEMKLTLESSDNQITQYCGVLVEKISVAETKLNNCEKRYDFLREDYERTVKELNDLQQTTAAIVGDLKKQIIEKSSVECKLEDNLSSEQNSGNDPAIRYNEYIALKIQLAYITKCIFTDDAALQNIVENMPSFLKCGIINDDFQVDYITYQEYDQLKSELNNLTKTVVDLTQQRKHLESLLAVSDEQIKSQQKQLMELTDNQVNLRHLIADLQSTNEDKFIISKAYRDIETAREKINKIKSEKQQLENTCNGLRSQLEKTQKQTDSMESKYQEANSNTSIKLQYLKKSLFKLQEKYCKFTPLILITDFLVCYARLTNKTVSKLDQMSNDSNCPVEDIISKLKIDVAASGTDNLVKLIKYEAKCKFLEEHVTTLNNQIVQLQAELENVKLSMADETEHWKTINALFSEPTAEAIVKLEDKEIQCQRDLVDASTNTDPAEKADPAKGVILNDRKLEVKDDHLIASCPSSPSLQTSKIIAVRSLESQLKQAMHLASKRNALLLETENRLAESQGRVKEMEKIIEEKNTLLKQQSDRPHIKDDGVFSRRSSLVETTIASLQALLTEKDNTLSHYQELLKTEREQHTKSCESYERELDALQKKYNDVETRSKAKSADIVELKSKLDALGKRAALTSQLDADDEIKQLADCDNNFNEISDEKIEEMFLDDNEQFSQEFLHGTLHIEGGNEPMDRYVQRLQTQINETINREKFWEKSTKTKEEEIDILKEKLALVAEREKLDIKSGPEIEQLQALLDEKDKHINDLMETLSNFHDDQQRLINETSLYSADQVSQLGADLTRSETTNRILGTQLEALRRQVSNLTQREKQARELVNSLRSQLIKRPVVSVKSELNTRAKQEQQQKRLQLMETELADMRKENRRLATLLDEKRAKNAHDLALWEKQKRWQQNAEKLKVKLSETEANLEKTKIMLNAAKTTINRFEKEKNALEARLRGASAGKCCRTPSCPNILLTKGCLSETTDTNTTSECNSPARRDGAHQFRYIDISDSNTDIINALKARIESQQRRIIALELERKGSNALTTELEKCQEKLAAVEAQNIRLEAKNLQLQLDVDLLKQGDERERLNKRIKYLEDYVLALKEELAQAEAQKNISGSEVKFSSNSLSHPEQTILSLRRIVERLRVENKNLKEMRSCFDSKRDLKAGGDFVQELQSVKEKLRQKTQLLEKAKILLTRAAAKEKNLKEQISVWKRKCSELQNVPVIDEISE